MIRSQAEKFKEENHFGAEDIAARAASAAEKYGGLSVSQLCSWLTESGL